MAPPWLPHVAIDQSPGWRLSERPRGAVLPSRDVGRMQVLSDAIACLACGCGGCRLKTSPKAARDSGGCRLPRHLKLARDSGEWCLTRHLRLARVRGGCRLIRHLSLARDCGGCRLKRLIKLARDRGGCRRPRYLRLARDCGGCRLTHQSPRLGGTCLLCSRTHG